MKRFLKFYLPLWLSAVLIVCSVLVVSERIGIKTASAAPALVQTVQGNGGGYVNSYTKTITLTAGNLATICFAAGAADTVTFTDNKSDSWTKDVEINLTSQRKATQWHASNVVGGSTIITVQMGASQFADTAIIIQEWSGMATSSNFDKSATSTVTSGTTYAVGPTGATTQASEIAIGCIGADSNAPSYTGDAGYTNLLTQAGFDAFTSVATQYKILSSTGTQSWTVTNASGRQASLSLATFKALAAAAAVNDAIFYAGD